MRIVKTFSIDNDLYTKICEIAKERNSTISKIVDESFNLLIQSLENNKIQKS